MVFVVHKDGDILYLGNDSSAVSLYMSIYGDAEAEVRAESSCSDFAKKALEKFRKDGEEVHAEKMPIEVIRLRNARLVQMPSSSEPLRLTWWEGRFDQRNMSASLLSDKSLKEALKHGESIEVVHRYMTNYPKNKMTKRLQKILNPTTKKEDDLE